MIYDTLAKYYDLLVKDDEATQQWIDFTKRNVAGNYILELACGSGEITIALAVAGYHIYGSDLSEEMLNEAKKKKDATLVSWQQLDMLKLDAKNEYDAVICYCDSLNYIDSELKVQQLFKRVYDALKSDGVFLFDVHSVQRKNEFEMEYIEEGMLDDIGYQWTIRHEDDVLYHNFAFYDENGNMVQEQHCQYIYDATLLKEFLENCGFKVEVYTDFTILGVTEGEKIFFVAKKEE